MTEETMFSEAVESTQRAASTFVSGDAEPFKNRWTQAHDVSIFGGWGAYEVGWEQVGPRLDWAAARFAAGSVDCEAITSGSSGDLGYTIGLERGQVQLAGNEELRPMLLRVTHIYRREGDDWKLIHRHADPVTEKTPVGAVLQQ